MDLVLGIAGALCMAISVYAKVMYARRRYSTEGRSNAENVVTLPYRPGKR